MKIYFRVDNLHIYDEYFGHNHWATADKIRAFFKEKNYGDFLDGFYPVIVLRDKNYYKMIEEDPSQIKLFQYYPKIKFKRNDKTLISYVEVHHEDVRNANTISACEKIVARAFLKSIDNADEFAKPNQRIDFKQMNIDLIMFYATNAIQF